MQKITSLSPDNVTNCTAERRSKIGVWTALEAVKVHEFDIGGGLACKKGPKRGGGAFLWTLLPPFPPLVALLSRFSFTLLLLLMPSPTCTVTHI